MVSTETIRTVTVRGRSEGLDKLSGDLQRVTQAHQGVATVTDISTRKSLSLDQATHKMRMSLDEAFRATTRFEQGQRLLGRAFDAGKIDLMEHARLVDLLGQKYRVADAAQDRLKTGMGGFGALSSFGLGAGLGMFLDPTSLVTGVTRAVSAVDDLGDASERAGISAEKLQVFRFALEQNAGSAADADSALQRFNKSVGEMALTGTGPAAVAFDALDISIRDASGSLRSQGSLLDEVVGKLGRVEDQSQIAAVSARLFGKDAGVGLASTLSQGTDAMLLYERELRGMGGMMSGETLEAAERLDREFKALQLTMSVNFRTAAVIAGQAFSDMRADMRETGRVALEFWNNPSLRNFSKVMIGPAATDQLTTLPTDELIDRAFLDADKIRMTDVIELYGALDRKIHGVAAVTLDLDETRKAGVSALDRQRQAIDDVLASLDFEYALLGKSEVEQRVMNELRRAGADAASEEGLAIAEKVRRIEAERYEQDLLAEAYRKVIERMDETRAVSTDLFRGVIDDARSGALGINTVADAADRLSDKFADMAANSLSDAIFGKQGSSSFGLFSSLMGSILGPSSQASAAIASGAGGLMHSGGFVGTATTFREDSLLAWANAPRLHSGGGFGLASDERRAVLQTGEYVMSRSMVQQARQGGGGFTFAPVTTIDARGSTMGEAQFRKILDERDRQWEAKIPGMAIGAIRDGRRYGDRRLR
jgi:hypothetical protein